MHPLIGKRFVWDTYNLYLNREHNCNEFMPSFLLQDQFIEMGGARTLCALLHSSNERLIFEAAMTISYIVSDSENNRKAIIDDEGYVSKPAYYLQFKKVIKKAFCTVDTYKSIEKCIILAFACNRKKLCHNTVCFIYGLLLLYSGR